MLVRPYKGGHTAINPMFAKPNTVEVEVEPGSLLVLLTADLSHKGSHPLNQTLIKTAMLRAGLLREG